jgi:hypothetical protein
MRFLYALSSMLEPEEREAVLGDLAEAGEPNRRAFFGVLGLVVRRQAALWSDWRPWLMLVGFVIPAGVTLHLVARWDTGLAGSTALREDLLWFAILLARTLVTLACWSFLAGGVLRTLSPRTVIVQGPALLFVMIASQSLDLMRLTSASSPPRNDSHEAAFYGVLLPWLVQILFVAIPLTCGMFNPLSRIVLFGVAVTVVEFLCHFLVRTQLNYHLPALVMSCVVYWPMAYVTIRIASRWARVAPIRK